MDGIRGKRNPSAQKRGFRCWANGKHIVRKD